MKREEWKEKYDGLCLNATWGEADRLIEQLSVGQLKEFIDAHRTVKRYTGLDMRQIFMLTRAKCELKKKTGEETDD